MSVLIRFDTGLKRIKARMFEQGSRKMECSICKDRKFGVLLRYIEPVKTEKLICHECLVKLADSPVVVQPVSEPVAPAAPTKKKTKKRSLKSKKGQTNGKRTRQNNEGRAQAGQADLQDQHGQVLSQTCD